MPVPQYGVVKGEPVSWALQLDGRAELLLQVDNDTPILAVVNVTSQDRESELICWLDSQFNQPQLISQLTTIAPGFHLASKEKVPTLDLLQGKLVSFSESIRLPYEREGEEEPPNITDKLGGVILRAIANQAIAYVFGSFGSSDRLGHFVHNIHLNQGSSALFRPENSRSQDGGILFEFSDGHWEAIFIAFGSQASTTDNFGRPTGPHLRSYQRLKSWVLREEDTSDPKINESPMPCGGKDDELEAESSELALDGRDPGVFRAKILTCKALFRDCQEYPILSGEDWIDQMAAKFSWWSLGVGAEKGGRYSLDYCLRSRDDVHSTLLRLLTCLEISLQKCINIGTSISMHLKLFSYVN